MIFYDIIFMENGCKQCLQFVCKILKTNSTNSTNNITWYQTCRDLENTRKTHGINSII